MPLNRCRWFLTFDLASGYQQVGLDHNEKQKSFFLADCALYTRNVMPATFKRLMDRVLTEFHWETLLISQTEASEPQTETKEMSLVQNKSVLPWT